CSSRKFSGRCRARQLAPGISELLRLIQAWDCLEAHAETIHSSRSIRKQPVQRWFVCTTDDGLELRSSELSDETQSWRLSLRADGNPVGSRRQASRRHEICARRSSARWFPRL